MVSHTRRDSQTSTDTCLAMLVRDEASLIARCLYSVRSHIDAWVVFDTGSTDATEVLVRDILGHLPGEIRRVPFTTFSDLRNRLLEAAAGFAATALFLDADEILDVDDGLTRPAGVGLVETGPPTHSFFPARLVPTHTRARFVDPVAEWLDTESSGVETAVAPGMRIWHLADGYRWRSSTTARRDMVYLETALSMGGDRIQTELSLAHAALRAGCRERAQEVLESAVARDTGNDPAWYARYLLALVLEQAGRPFDAAREHFTLAHEMQPDRLEPLARLVRMTQQEGDLQTAFALGQVGLEIRQPRPGYYVEPLLYQHRFRTRQAEICLALGRYDDAFELTRALLSDNTLPIDVRSRIRNLDDSIGRSRGKSVSAAPPDHEPAGPVESPRLTIGMATFDDFDGVFFSIQSLCMHHGIAHRNDIEILVLDNNPGGPCSGALQRLENRIPHYRYIARGDVRGTAVRDLVFREARGDIVLCMDSHVLVTPGGIDALLEFFEGNPQSADLVQGPLHWDDHASRSTHMEPTWNEGFYGVWKHRDGDSGPFEIPMQGLGLFACRRQAWPGFNPRFRGFGGEEGYIHEKFRRAGGRCLCLPGLGWLHRFERPHGVKYELNWADRVRNYMIGFDEVGLDVAAVEKHFIDHLSPAEALPIIMKTRREIDNPFHFFDALYCINLARNPHRWASMCERFERLGIADRVVRFEAISTPGNHHVGCTLSHRAIVEDADARGLDNVLIFEDDALFVPDTLHHLRASIRELGSVPWRVFYLGGHRWGTDIDPVDGCQHLGHARQLTCTHAVAYHRRVFQDVLRGIPADETTMRQTWKRQYAIDQFLLTRVGDRFVSLPVVASQGSILDQEAPDVRASFA